MSGDFDKQFNDMVSEFEIVGPLSIPDILEGMKSIMEANLYLSDYLSEFFVSMDSVASELAEVEADPDGIFLEMPAFSHEATIFLRTLFDAATSFCEIVTSQGDEEE